MFSRKKIANGHGRGVKTNVIKSQQIGVVKVLMLLKNLSESTNAFDNLSENRSPACGEIPCGSRTPDCDFFSKDF